VEEGKVSSGTVMMLVGFGVGYSWGAAILRWR
jgi:3-oxoacyl-[acyl-carrier-protein] synthase III